MAKKKKRVLTVRAIRPNLGLEREYRRGLLKLVQKMHRSVRWWLRAAYRRNAEKIAIIAEDASPARDLMSELRRLLRRWAHVYDEEGKRLACRLIEGARKHGDTAMRNALKSAGITVSFSPSRAEQYMMSSLIEGNVSLIKTIPQRYFSEVEGLVQSSVQSGRDLAELTEELDARYTITRKRAAMIARDQNNKVTDGLNRVRDNSLGITEGIWIHVPGNKSSRHSHMQMDGKKFKLNEGMYDPDVDRYIHCGELINCNCIYKAVIPTFGEPTREGSGEDE